MQHLDSVTSSAQPEDDLLLQGIRERIGELLRRLEQDAPQLLLEPGQERLGELADSIDDALGILEFPERALADTNAG